MKRLNSVKNRQYKKCIVKDTSRLNEIEKRIDIARKSLELSRKFHPKRIARAAKGEIV